MTMNENVPDTYANAVVVLANDYQFDKSEQKRFSDVHSRMLLWGKSGVGEVIVNRTKITLLPGEFLFTPWAHAITYLPDAREPFGVAGIHIIPDHARNQSVEFRVAHTGRDALADCAWRRDQELSELSGLRTGSFSTAPELASLAEHVVYSYRAGALAEWQMRHLARLVLANLHSALYAVHSVVPKLPLVLRQMVQFIESHVTEPLSLVDLVQFSGLSASGVGRIFKRHLRMSPVRWIATEKMRHAQQLLTTGGLSVNAIGRAVGIDDPYYFSKRFKEITGRTPLEYRRVHSLL